AGRETDRLARHGAVERAYVKIGDGLRRVEREAAPPGNHAGHVVHRVEMAGNVGCVPDPDSRFHLVGNAVQSIFVGKTRQVVGNRRGAEIDRSQACMPRAFADTPQCSGERHHLPLEIEPVEAVVEVVATSNRRSPEEGLGWFPVVQPGQVPLQFVQAPQAHPDARPMTAEPSQDQGLATRRDRGIDRSAGRSLVHPISAHLRTGTSVSRWLRRAPISRTCREDSATVYASCRWPLRNNATIVASSSSFKASRLIVYRPFRISFSPSSKLSEISIGSISFRSSIALVKAWVSACPWWSCVSTAWIARKAGAGVPSLSKSGSPVVRLNRSELSSMAM